MEDMPTLEDRVAAAFAETDAAVGVADLLWTRHVLVEVHSGVDEGDGLAALACLMDSRHHELYH